MTFTTHHPLDPLSEDEIRQVAAIIRDTRGDKAHYVFSSVSLHEPSKEKVLAQLPVDREAIVILLDRPSGQVHEMVISLTQHSITRWTQPANVQPTLHVMEMIEAEKIILKDSRVIEECTKRGITDMSTVYADTWAVGFHEQSKTRRLMQALMYMRTSKEDNQYAHPLDFFPIYDVNKQEVIEINYGIPRNSKYARPTIPMKNHPFLPEQLDSLRQDLKPIEIIQPEGVSFKIRNQHELEWQKWKLHIGYNYREGVVLHQIQYQIKADEDYTPLIYRISLSEMVVPYANPYRPYCRKVNQNELVYQLTQSISLHSTAAFDLSEYGAMNNTNSLSLGCDCVGSIAYLDAVLCDMHGNPWIIPNAICIHEEETSLLHKHTDYRTGKAHSARMRRLVISQIITVANYDYGLYFYFYVDGSMEYEVKATGELNTHVLAEDEDPKPYGTIVAPQVVGQFHQHLFCMRIDPMLSGVENSVAQVDWSLSEYPTGHPDNEFGNAFYRTSTIFENSEQAQTVGDASKGRSWRIINENKIHPYTKDPIGFKLTSPNNVLLMAQPDSIVARRAVFATKTLWIVPYQDNQVYPAGFYCNQSTTSMGLPVWTNESKPIRNKDIVLYFTFGMNHGVRVEDFPIMPVESCGFTLKPDGFFTGNPAVDMPSTASRMSVHVLATKQDNNDGLAKLTTCCSTK